MPSFFILGFKVVRGPPRRVSAAVTMEAGGLENAWYRVLQTLGSRVTTFGHLASGGQPSTDDRLTG